MNKFKKQPKTALGAVVVEMPQNVNSLNSDATEAQEQPQEEKTPVEPEKTKTLEEVLAENERLRNALENQPKTLQEKIDFFKRKEVHIKQLNRVNGQRESVFTALESVTEKAQENDFVTELFCLSVTQKHNIHSREEEVFKLNNPVVIGEVLQFVISRLDVKRDELQLLIEA